MTSSRLLARTLALTTSLVAVAACDSDGRPFDTLAPPTEAVAAQGPSQVIVTNTDANPVKTQAVGTTSVAGSVTATQAGAWNVHVDNSSLAVAGTVAVSGGSIAATQAGAWGVTVTDPVTIAPGASVAVSALPPVSIVGTPQVTVAGIPTVALAGTPTVAIAGGAQVSGAVEVTNLPAVQEVSGTVDVAPKQIRWGSEVRSQPGSIELPAGLVLTDLTVTLYEGECRFELLESVFHGAGIRQLMSWPLDSTTRVIDLHLQSGISARNLAGPEQLALNVTAANCEVRALWSGYMP